MNPISATSALSQVGQIHDVGGIQSPGSAGQKNKAKGADGFADLFQNFVNETNKDQVVSDLAIKDFVTGKTDNVQQVVLAMTNADMSFQLFMEIRNKLIDSYNELMRMQF